MVTFIRIGFAAALAFGATVAIAADIRVTHSRCSPQVHVVARNAPLSAVLKKLAEVLEFQLHFASDSDPQITIDVTQPSDALAAQLAPGENVSMMLDRDPGCSGQQRILKVWVLPNGSAGSPRTLAASDPQVNEQARLAKEAGEMILKAHGMDVSGQPLVR